MRADGKDLLRGEVALRVDRNLAARYPDRVAGRYAAALYLHRAAAERNLLPRQVVLAIGGQQVLEFACRARKNFCCWMPFRKTRLVDSDDLERHGLQGLLLLEYSNFSTLDKACIAAVHPEMYDRFGRAA